MPSYRVLKFGLLWGILIGGGVFVPADAQTVQKVAEPFDSTTWHISDDTSAGGSTKVSDNVAPELMGASKNSVDFEAAFSGGGFEFFKGVPGQPLVIPGLAKKISVWVRADTKYGWVIQMRDGWGRTEVNGQKLEWNISKGADGNWKKMSFDVPADWVQPIAIDGVLVHNYGQTGDKASALLHLDQLEVETDTSDVDAQTGLLKTWKAPPPAADPKAPVAQEPTTPLLQMNLAATEAHNVFSGTAPKFLFSAKNWRPQAASGTLNWKVLDWTGDMVKSGTQSLKVEDNFALPLPIATSKFGVYRLDSSITWDDGKTTTTSQPFALIPVARPLSDAEKDASPYGLNVLSARQPMPETFRKAGIVWFRDYGFNYDWMVRAKGADHSYGGWPWYPKIVKAYDNSGARVLADLQSAIHPPSGDKVGPDLSWTRELVGIETAFPSLRNFELDNEYDLHRENVSAEEASGWKNYGDYHKKFGEVTQLMGNGQFLAVENGRAGIWPERVRQQIQSGAFDSIGVVNSHYYAGVPAPELSATNYNTGVALQETSALWFDQLRAMKKVASSDGKPRQHWLTEFGWDTKAGPVVSPVEQAAYLARAYMMLSAAGTEKGFWYWDLDSPGANNFFDGCGLFTFDQLPKLSYAAYAGLTQMLPKAQYIGMISAGDNTWGYLFRNEGKLVASLWTLDGKNGPNVNFEGAKVYDFLANPLAKTDVNLGLAPVYAVGVSEDSRWAHQAAYSLATPYLVSVTAGDAVTTSLQIKNTRQTPIGGKVRLQLPTGWSDTSGEQTISVAPGKTVEIPLSFHIGNDEGLGEKTVHVGVSEAEPLVAIPLRVGIGRPIAMTVRGLRGEPGQSEVKVRVSNLSARPLDGALHFKLPAGWSTVTPEIKVDALKPNEVRDFSATVNWTASWKQGEQALVEYRSADGRTAQQPLIPSRLTLYKAPDDLKMDGDLKDWPAQTKLPDWVMGSTQGNANASAYMAWSSQGLYLALEVRDSKGQVPDPRAFWEGDVAELFLDTRDKKTPRQYEVGDHQFWFAPQLDQKRAYVGQWKRGNEIPETHYDIAGLQSIALRKGDGYVLECLLPASQIKDFKAVAGTRLGLNLNLTIKGAHGDREVFWPMPKADGVEQPASWGTVTLGN
ncbi:hypothetical protein IAD21_04487 [Abditibacteriota bacterium]|nr:hypothetical protein IAD21_04487 [Abditibacteriota bacterium]